MPSPPPNGQELLVEHDLLGSPAEAGLTQRQAIDGAQPQLAVAPDVDRLIESRTHPPVTMLWALGVTVACARWIFSHDRSMFHMAPDEPGQLAMARFISGGPRWNLFDHATWAPGQATLMAPLFWLTEETSVIIHGGLMIGAALGGIGAVLLARLGTRLTTLSPTACVVAAGVIGVAPAQLSATAFVWSEALVSVCFLSVLTLVLKFYDEPRASIGCAAVTMAAAGFVAHGRLLPLAALTVAAIGFKCLVSRHWLRAVALAGVTGLAIATAMLYTRFVYDRVWDNPGTSNTSRTVWKRLPHLDDNLRSALGQVWYQLIATLGLAAIGGVILLRRSVQRRRRAPYRAIRDARLVIFLTLPLVLVSIVFMSGRTRTDHRIYGRYNDAILWPVLLVGIGWVIHLRSNHRPRASAALLAAIAALIIAASIGVERVAGAALDDSAGVRPMIAGMIPMLGTANSIDVARVTVVALIAMTVMVAASLLARRGRLLIPLAVLTLAWCGWYTHDRMSTRLNSWEPALAVRAIDELIPPDADLGIRFVRDDEDDTPPISWDDQRRRGQIYQFALPNHRFVRDHGPDDDVGPFVFAPVGDRLMRESGAELIWTDPKLKFGLWEEAPR